MYTTTETKTTVHYSWCVNDNADDLDSMFGGHHCYGAEILGPVPACLPVAWLSESETGPVIGFDVPENRTGDWLPPEQVRAYAHQLLELVEQAEAEQVTR